MSKPGLQGVLERYDELEASAVGAKPSWYETREWLVKAIECEHQENEAEKLRSENDSKHTLSRQREAAPEHDHA